MEKASELFPERKGDYHFPTLDLDGTSEEESNEDEDHMIKARNLKETLAQFKVEIELGEVHTGPESQDMMYIPHWVRGKRSQTLTKPWLWH